jgi:hypothetical protein
MRSYCKRKEVNVDAINIKNGMVTCRRKEDGRLSKEALSY